MYNIINQIKKLTNIRVRFDFPKSNKILKYNEGGIDLLKRTIKRDFNIMPTVKKEIYFWIFIRQIIFFDFSFETYFKNFIKFTSTKIVINIYESNMFCYKVKNALNNISFITIQNGHRNLKEKMFQKIDLQSFNNLKTDHMFVHNKYIIEKYKRFIKSNNFHIVGSYNNNSNYRVGKTKYKNSFIFIGYGKTSFSFDIGVNFKLLYLLNSYFLNTDKRLYILLKSKKAIDQKVEINFYRKFISCKHTFIKSKSKSSPYKTLDKYENIIFTNSTLGYEAIARKKKVAVFPVDQKKINPKYFGWPKKYNRGYDFFLGKKLTYNEVERVLENVSNCKQLTWNKNYYKKIQDLMHFDKNNTKLRRVIHNILKNSYKLKNNSNYNNQ